MIADLHTHTYICGHADGKPEEYLRSAISKNARYYGISEHAPWPVGFDLSTRSGYERFPEYLALVEKMRKMAEGSGTEVLCGIEIDHVPYRMKESMQYLKDNEKYFDYILGSVHWADDIPFDHPDFRYLWEREGASEKIWNLYFDCMTELIAYGGFDILSHFDLPKKMGYPYAKDAKFYSRVRDILKTVSEKGMFMEINTAGFHNDAREQYPSLEILKIAHEYGIHLTYGSDAHSPEYVAYKFEDAARLAAAAGYKCFYAFKKRKPFEIPFD